MAIEIRRLTSDDNEAAMHTFTTAMQFGPLTGDAWERAQLRSYPERSFGVFEDGRMVANTRSYPFATLVPGGAVLPTAGVSAVGTLPTHRRRGFGATVLAAQLRDVHEQGEPLASLRASQATIYERFGYGVAGHAASVEVHTRRGGLRRRLHDDGRFEFVSGPDVVGIVRPLESRALRRPGMFRRPEPIILRDFGSVIGPHGDAATRMVVHRDGRGRIDGCAQWAPVDREAWHNPKPPTIEASELWAVTPGVEALLWQFLFDLDLVEVVKVWSRPVDDPLRWLLADQRDYEIKEYWDEQWLRLVDVPVALAARTYNDAAGSVVIRVTDPILPANSGRYEIAAGGATRSRRAADLDLSIELLGAIYLGGTSVSELVAAGRVDERRRGAAARADLLLHSALAPWCGSFF
jgi:predicted acetyltransferase